VRENAIGVGRYDFPHKSAETIGVVVGKPIDNSYVTALDPSQAFKGLLKSADPALHFSIIGQADDHGQAATGGRVLGEYGPQRTESRA
jgi:hypothetical protein